MNSLKTLFLYIHGVLQATLTDRAVGGFLVGLALAIFVYYTLWVIVLVRLMHQFQHVIKLA